MKKILFALIVHLSITAVAQQNMVVTDSIPVTYQGLKAGYLITDASEKEVGKKGNFSRYKLKFYITNTGNEAKIVMQKPGMFFNTGSLSPDIAEFKCSNATGARFTNKNATLHQQPCRIDAMVDEKECGSDKVVQNKRLVDIGYWIKPGETIATNTIMIVPLNESPQVTVSFYPNTNSLVGSPVNNPTDPLASSNEQGFVHLKNFASNYYLHNQNGPLACTGIDNGWWSAQWEILPVNGTNNFQIRNRWKNNFITTENSTLISDNGRSANAMWLMEETGISNIFYIKNTADNTKLIYQNGILKTSGANNTDAIAQWIIEK